MTENDHISYACVEAVAEELEDIKVSYLKSWGWKATCQAPHSYWLWEHPNVPLIGRMVCGTETAIDVTKAWNGIEGEWREAHGRQHDR